MKDILAFSDTGASDEVLQDLPSEAEGYATRGTYSGPGSPHTSDGDASCSDDMYGSVSPCVCCTRRHTFTS